ncbi:DUF4430 domain-containing protein [Thalassobacillus devorans]|uniref:DUF4430 domain-containing protein n=1 Tax=Thalassobacillus devorans TaxID=279813 RepID=UPI00048ABF1C|nr:DUF4430 domain-containing protein [Thalassobacillus devorans]
MRRMMQMILAVMLSAVVLGACQADSGSESSDAQTQDQQQEVPVKVTVSKKNGEKIVAEKELEVKAGTTLMEVLKNNFDDVEEKDGFVTKIEGIEAKEGEQKAWFFTINGESASVGAEEYKVEADDTFQFDFHKWE